MGHLKRFLHHAHERGVMIGLGTDTPFPHHVAGEQSYIATRDASNVPGLPPAAIMAMIAIV